MEHGADGSDEHCEDDEGEGEELHHSHNGNTSSARSVATTMAAPCYTSS